jgi:hypothetical protein
MHNIHKHICVKSYEGSLKAMEADALVRMLKRIPDEKGVYSQLYQMMIKMQVQRLGMKPMAAFCHLPLRNHEFLLI